MKTSGLFSEDFEAFSTISIEYNTFLITHKKTQSKMASQDRIKHFLT